MDKTTRIHAFATLGKELVNLSDQEFNELAQQARNENAWFTIDSVRQALSGITSFLDESKLRAWLADYPEVENPRRIALIMAGNIPLVGFHDLLCVLILGHQAVIKLSSKDQQLPRNILARLFTIEPALERQVVIADQLKNFDAVIATGSDNSARYFHHYFGKYPHIIRKNRTSVAVLTGKETAEDYHRLGSDIFSYFGLGCRNVSKLYVPREFEFSVMLDSLKSYSEIIHHHKYVNNYDYQKSILLINRIPFLDNGFVLLQENERLVSPISVLYFEYYDSQAALSAKLNEHADKIQVIVGDEAPGQVRFGSAQCPQLTDYADNVDTLQFLTSLK